MKKVFLMMAVAGFFSMVATSCGEKTEETDAKTEEGHDHAEGEEHAH